MSNQSRRSFLGLAGVATAATAIIAAPAVEEPPSTDRFEHPAEYLAAMQAIGWQPLAMFHWLPGDAVQRMGVHEKPKAGVDVGDTWDSFHAIQMRTPVQRPSDYPPGDWWAAVWQHIYDHGFRQDVTPTKCRKRDGEADHEA